MGQINIEGIKLYAYHGCLKEEEKIGSNYEVDIYIDADFSQASLSDDLSQTIDYVIIYELVKKQMAIRSQLLEEVAKRIHTAILVHYSTIHKLKVAVAKINPPMNGNVERVTIVVEE